MADKGRRNFSLSAFQQILTPLLKTTHFIHISKLYTIAIKNKLPKFISWECDISICLQRYTICWSLKLITLRSYPTHENHSFISVTTVDSCYSILTTKLFCKLF